MVLRNTTAADAKALTATYLHFFNQTAIRFAPAHRLTDNRPELRVCLTGDKP